MKTINIHTCKQWLKTSKSPIATSLVSTLKAIRALELPAPKYIFAPLDAIYVGVNNLLANITRLVIWTPLFKSRLCVYGKRVYLYGGIPYMAGPLRFHIGNDCRISGKTTITARSCATTPPELYIGSNVDVGWQTTLAVGKRMTLGNNVRIAGQCFLAGYPGHPINTIDRANGLPETDAQVGDIFLENDVWLATGVMVMAGVTIGEGTIVAAGSVVTKSLPAKVLAAGCPAVPVRSLTEKNQPLTTSDQDTTTIMPCHHGSKSHAA